MRKLLKSPFRLRLVTQGIATSDQAFNALLFRFWGYAFLVILFSVSQFLALHGRPMADYLLGSEGFSGVESFVGLILGGTSLVGGKISEWMTLFFFALAALSLLVVRLNSPLLTRAAFVAFAGVLAFVLSFFAYRSFIISCLSVFSFFIICCLAAIYEIFKIRRSADFLKYTLDVCIKFVQLSLVIFALGVGLLRFVSEGRGVDGDSFLSVMLFVGAGYFFNISLFSLLVVVPLWVLLLDESATPQPANDCESAANSEAEE